MLWKSIQTVEAGDSCIWVGMDSIVGRLPSRQTILKPSKFGEVRGESVHGVRIQENTTIALMGVTEACGVERSFSSTARSGGILESRDVCGILLSTTKTECC